MTDRYRERENICTCMICMYVCISDMTELKMSQACRKATSNWKAKKLQTLIEGLRFEHRNHRPVGERTPDQSHLRRHPLRRPCARNSDFAREELEIFGPSPGRALNMINMDITVVNIRHKQRTLRLVEAF